MQSLFKKNRIGATLFLIAGSFSAFGQDIADLSGQEEPGGASTAQNTPAEAQKAESGSKSALDYLYNRKPQDGSAAANLQRTNQRLEDKELASEALGSSGSLDPDSAARFERYLGAAEVPSKQVQAYLDAVDEVHEVLQTKKPVHAWGKLIELTQHEQLDADVSYELANRIESIWNLDKAVVRLQQQNKNLKEEIGTHNRSADMMSNRIIKQELEIERKRQGIQSRQQGNQGGGSQQSPYPTPPGAGQGSQGGGDIMATLGGKLRLTEEYLSSLENKARIKMNEMQMSALDEKAKENFASYIGTLFNSKRYLHVILAANFYRRIFNDSEYPVEMANQVNASLEIMQDLQSTIEVFRYKVKKGDIANAAERLQEAFMLGETHPLVLGIERPYKEKVGDFSTKLVKMRNLIEAREFGDLETLLNNMQEQASDFDSTKARAIINAVKLESKLRLGKAKLAAQKGNLDLAMEEFQAAAQAWPANPDLESSANQFFDTNDVQNQSLTDFDRDFETENFRKIYKNQLAYAPAVKGDKGREEKLKQALEKVQHAEMAIEKANILARNGDHFGAWEAIELAVKDWEDDRELNRLRADLTGRSAEFVAAINRAKDAEDNGDLGYSLTWYLNAQRRYPASRISNEAIERLSEQILNPGKTTPPVTEEASNDVADSDAA